MLHAVFGALWWGTVTLPVLQQGSPTFRVLGQQELALGWTLPVLTLTTAPHQSNSPPLLEFLLSLTFGHRLQSSLLQLLWVG